MAGADGSTKVSVTRSTRWTRVALTALISVAAAPFVYAGTAQAGLLWVHACGSFGQGQLAASPAPPGIAIGGNPCPGGPIEMKSKGTAANGARESLQMTSPSPAISIVYFWVDSNSLGVTGINDGTGFFGGFYWAGGTASAFDGMTSYSSPLVNSPYAGVRMVCGWSKCTNTGAYIDVYDFNVEALENSGPNIVPTSPLWYQTGWIRGVWPLYFDASDASGVCNERAFVNGQKVQGPTTSRDQTQWDQCQGEGPFAQDIRTGDYADGTVPLMLQATNAAYVGTSYAENLKVDNQPPTIAISGPTDAPVTAGVQYLAVNATAGPSGVAGISCSLDGAPPQWYQSAATSVAVTGIGVHHLTCSSANNARDASGSPNSSAPETWTLGIRQPSVSAVAFVQVVDALRCVRVRERVRIPARWVTVRVQGQNVRIKLRAQTQTVKLVRCHPHFARRRVRVRGRWRTERVPILPHTARATSRRIPFGASTTVSGWLGTSQGVALGGQRVLVVGAADNGMQQFTQLATATTGADGSWTARLPAGPSRIIEADYPGSTTAEPSTSAPAHVVVPASIRLTIAPRSTHWGGTIMITGRLRGAHVPPAGELVVLRIGWPGGSTEAGHLYTARDGRFGTTYTFLRGNGTETYRLWVESAKESDYPYAVGASKKIAITVGP